VIVLVIDGLSILTSEFESHPPVPAHGYSPSSFSVTLERVKVQSRKRHISRASSGAEATQDQTQPFGMLCLNTSLGAGFEELGQPLVFEPRITHADCNPGRYSLTSVGGLVEIARDCACMLLLSVTLLKRIIFYHNTIRTGLQMADSHFISVLLTNATLLLSDDHEGTLIVPWPPYT
jgi:hypothetical protein